MSFTAKQVKAILSNYGVSLENLDVAAEEICGRHKADLDSIKEERDEYREKMRDFDQMRADLETTRTDLKTAQDALKEAQPYKEKYDKEHADFEAFKTDVSGKETKAKADKNFYDLLKSQGYSEFGIESIMDSKKINPEFDESGNIKDADKLLESIKSSNYGQFLNSPVKTEGVQTAQPPATKSSGMTKDDIMKIKDPTERINAIKANPDAFGLTNKE